MLNKFIAVKETRFIEQNKEKWEQFESQLKNKEINSDELRNMFIQVTDDLSYARTFYPNRSVKVYLNILSQKFFVHIYKNRSEFWKAFKQFWTDDLPQVCYNERKTILISFLVLMVSLLIGVFSTIKDHDFPTYIMGSEYVSMTKANIAKGKPFDVYAKENQTDMFIGIGLNNLYACFRTFIFGLLFGIGSLGMLLYMGIEIGTFHTIFFQASAKIFIGSLLTVWLHGTIEIGCLILSAAAGLTLARGMLFPGTFSRWQSFQLSGRRAVKIMLGVIPLIVVAAFIESFITRYADTPWVIKLLLIVASLILMVGYFVWYPMRKAKKGFFSGVNDVHNNFQPSYELHIPEGVQTNSDTLGNTFLYLSKLITPVLKYGMLLVSLLTLWYMYAEILFKKIGIVNSNNDIYDYESQGASIRLTSIFGKLYDLFFLGEGLQFLVIGYLIALGSIVVLSNYFLLKKWEIKLPALSIFFIKKIGGIMVMVVLANLILLIPNWLKMFLVPISYPMLFLFGFNYCFANIDWQDAFKSTWKLYWNNFGRNLGLNLIVFALISALVLLFANQGTSRGLFEAYEMVIRWNITNYRASTDKIMEAVLFFFAVFIGYISLVVWSLANAFQYFNLKEINEGNYLKKRIDSF